MTFNVGYRKPPKETQFAKGKSGNPKGRPKGSKNFLTLLEKELNALIVVNEGGRRKKVTRMEAIVKRIVAGGLQGDQKSLLAAVDVMRKTGMFHPAENQESLLPDDYLSILDDFMTSKGGP